MNKQTVCCICGRPVLGYGNNPYPVDKRENARCCDECNNAIVIPKRLEAVLKKRTKGE